MTRAGAVSVSPRRRALLISLVFALALLRFAVAVFSAVHSNRGDFAATLPGAYAERWNLTLWNSPDLANGDSFARHGYSYGPTQYLTLWPIVFLDSYRQIAAVLLPIYAAIVMVMAYLLWRLCELLVRDQGERRTRAMTVYAAVLLYGPLQTALAQREFEVVQALAIVAGARLVARGRFGYAGGALGYITPFKYWTAALLGFFLVTRQWKAVVTFVLTVAAVLVAAHLVFDLGRFPFASGAGIRQQFGRFYSTAARPVPFCAAATGTAASLRAGVCAMVDGSDRAARTLFYGLGGSAVAAFSVMFVLVRRRRTAMDDVEERWRQILEFCFFLTAAGVVLHGHYYYLAILILPLTLVFYRNFWEPGAGAVVKCAAALVAYAALSPFVVPVGVVARITGGDPWSFYLTHGIYAYGIAMVGALLLWEYWTIAREASW
jgi:hypothetical protein